MAEVKTSMIKHLMNTPAVFAAFANRIWADRIPDVPGGGAQPYPHARLFVVAAPRDYHYQGEGARQPLVQIDVFDDDVAGADTNADLIRAALSGFRGQMGSMNVGFVFVNAGPGTWDETTRNYRRILEARLATNA